MCPPARSRCVWGCVFVSRLVPVPVGRVGVPLPGGGPGALQSVFPPVLVSVWGWFVTPDRYPSGVCRVCVSPPASSRVLLCERGAVAGAGRRRGRT